MKFGILSILVACLTGIFTVIVFLNFLEQWKASETLQEILIKTPLFIKHLLISPKQLGIEKWHHGDSAAYQLRTNTKSQRISFYVATQESEENKHHWLRTDGLAQFNATFIELWRLLSETSIRPGTETDSFFYIDDTFLFPFYLSKFPPTPVLLQDLGTEIVKTPVGEFKCQHYFANIRLQGGKLKPLLELWTNSTVPPLGIVRARWRDETLDLVDVKSSLDIERPQALLSTSKQHRIREQGCTQCHQKGIGGRNLKFPAKYLLSGSNLNLTECLFHYYQTGLIQRRDPIHLQTLKKPGRIASREPVLFTWTKGSFWIKTNHRGQLTFSLDVIASQGNLRAIPQTGLVVLNLQK